MYRIGTGFDAHAFGNNGSLILGGVEIAHDRGLLGHSDADVLLHALCDALLGAASLPDIGQQFPPTDPQYKGISSIELLTRTVALVSSAGFDVVNIDSTAICENPKLAPYIPAMRETIAAALCIEPNRIGIKATTTEGLGFTGRGEGIAAQAVALLKIRASIGRK